jgi:hypothetical protein
MARKTIADKLRATVNRIKVRKGEIPPWEAEWDGLRLDHPMPDLSGVDWEEYRRAVLASCPPREAERILSNVEEVRAWIEGGVEGNHRRDPERNG